jgi:hypothetical protein
LAAAGVSCAVGIANLHTSDRLRSDGQVTRARVVGKHIERQRSWWHRYLDVEYRTPTGRVINARDGVARGLFDRVAVGDTVSVRYLPGDPEVHALGASPRRDGFMLWIAGLWFVLAGVYWRFGSETACGPDFPPVQEGNTRNVR